MPHSFIDNHSSILSALGPGHHKEESSGKVAPVARPRDMFIVSSQDHALGEPRNAQKDTPLI